jgi:serine/threonine protein phosphatase PrpC
MHSTIDRRTLDTQSSPEKGPMYIFKTCRTYQCSSKPTKNQDCILPNGFIGDGISQHPDSLLDSQEAAMIFTRIFSANITTLSKTQLDCKLLAFNQRIKIYCEQNNLPKIRTTIAFVIPFVEDGEEKLCFVSQGDSTIIGYTEEKECKQLNLNSHPLFKNISKQNIPELTNFAIQMQQIVRDNNIKYSDDKDKVIFLSASMINVNVGENYEIFLESMAVSASKMLLPPDLLTQKKSDLVVMQSIINPTREDQIVIRKLKKAITLAPVLHNFITTKEIRYLVEAYLSSMNVVDDFQTVTYQNTKDYTKLVISSDGVTDNITSDTLAKILNTNTGLSTINEMIVNAAKNAGKKPDHISSCLIEIREK